MSDRLPGLEGASDQRAPVVTAALVVYDRGPGPARHEGDGLGGPWGRYEAELADYAALREVGASPWEAVHRLIAGHRALLERRWSVWR